MPWQKRSALQSVVKQIADSNGRRLQAALMSEGCKAACPEVMDFLTAMGSTSEDDAAMMETMCANKATIECIAGAADCQDDGTKEIEEMGPMLGCVCACPAVMTADIKMEGNTLTPEECKAVSCVKGASGCKAMVDSADADAKKSMDSCDGDGGSSSDHAATQAGPFALLVLSVTALFA